MGVAGTDRGVGSVDLTAKGQIPVYGGSSIGVLAQTPGVDGSVLGYDSTTTTGLASVPASGTSGANLARVAGAELTPKSLEVTAADAPTVNADVVTAGNPYWVDAVGRVAYVTAYSGNKLQIIDTDTAAVIGETSSNISGPRSLAVSGDHAYVVNYGANTMTVYNVSNPSVPTYVGSVATSSGPFGIAISGTFAYVVCTGADKLEVFSIANPAAPSLVGNVATQSGPRFVDVKNRYAYVSAFNASKLEVIDVVDPTTPVSLGSVTVGGNPRRGIAIGRYVFVVTENGGCMNVVDCIAPSSPVVVATFVPESSSTLYGLSILGDYAYIAGYSKAKVYVVDISVPATPVLLTSVSVGTQPIGVCVNGNRAVVACYGASKAQILSLPNFTKMASAEMANLEATTATIRRRLDVLSDVTVGGGVTAGPGGVQTDGRMVATAFNIASPAVLATGASHTVDDVIAFLQTLGLAKQS